MAFYNLNNEQNLYYMNNHLNKCMYIYICVSNNGSSKHHSLGYVKARSSSAKKLNWFTPCLISLSKPFHRFTPQTLATCEPPRLQVTPIQCWVSILKCAQLSDLLLLFLLVPSSSVSLNISLSLFVTKRLYHVAKILNAERFCCSASTAM